MVSSSIFENKKMFKNIQIGILAFIVCMFILVVFTYISIKLKERKRRKRHELEFDDDDVYEKESLSIMTTYHRLSMNNGPSA